MIISTQIFNEMVDNR